MFGEERQARPHPPRFRDDRDGRTLSCGPRGRRRGFAPACRPEVHIVRTTEELNRLVARCKRTAGSCWTWRPSRSDELDAELVGISIALPRRRATPPSWHPTSPVGHTVDRGEVARSGSCAPAFDRWMRCAEYFGPFFSDRAMLKDAHNAKYDLWCSPAPAACAGLGLRHHDRRLPGGEKQPRPQGTGVRPSWAWRWRRSTT